MLTRVDLGYTQNIERTVVARGALFFEHADPSDARTFTRFGGGVGARYLWMENADLDMSLDWAGGTARTRVPTTTSSSAAWESPSTSGRRDRKREV